MPQRFGLYEDLTVLENLTLYADLRGVVGQQRKDTFERLLAFTDLARFTDRLAGALSGGMKQKLGLACAMLRSPKLLLLDEPSVGVDPISRRELWRMVYTLIGEGVGVVWSTAYLDEAENCAEVIVLNEGRVLFQGDPKAMTATMAGPRVSGARRRRRAPRGAGAGADAARDRRRRDAGRGDPARDRRRRAGAGAGHSRRRRLRSRSSPAAPRFEDAFVAHARRPAEAHAVGAGAQAPIDDNGAPPVEAQGLTRRFGDFTAADHITLRDQARRDLRPARPQRRRQVHHLQDDVRAAEAERGRGAGRRARPLPRRPRRRARGSATWRRNSRSTATSASRRIWSSSPAPTASPARSAATPSRASSRPST